MAQRRSEPDVLALRWDDFRRWFAERWEPGQHVALIGPTGTGKSTLAVGILPLRRWVLALDPKGGDSTLAGAGFERVPSWPPPRKVWKAIEEGRPARLIVGPIIRTTDDLPKLRRAQSDALAAAFNHGGWTVYIDELQVLADRRLMGLGASAERLLIAARDKGVSVVSSFQAPRWVPRAAADQSTWICVYYTRDTDVQNRIAEMVGRPKAEIRGAVNGLSEHCVLMFSRNPRHPIVVTKAAKVARRRPAEPARS